MYHNKQICYHSAQKTRIFHNIDTLNIQSLQDYNWDSRVVTTFPILTICGRRGKQCVCESHMACYSQRRILDAVKSPHTPLFLTSEISIFINNECLCFRVWIRLSATVYGWLTAGQYNYVTCRLQFFTINCTIVIKPNVCK